MLFQKFLLLGLPVIALAATTTTEEDEDEVATTSTRTTSTTKPTITSSSSKDDDEDEEDEDEDSTTTTTAKGSKSTSLSSSKNTTSSSWPYEAFGNFVVELPECTRGCFEEPISQNVTESCAKLDNWNCICHFYKPSFYKEVFNDTIPVTTTTRTPRKTASTTTTTEEPTATETEASEVEIASEDFFICIEDACGIKKWGNGRNEFFDNVAALNKYCETEEKTYDEARNKRDYKEIDDAKKALAAKKAAEDAKNAGGRLESWGFAATAFVAFAAAFAL